MRLFPCPITFSSLISAQTSANEEGIYCVGGTLRNPGGELQVYLVVVVVLYDNQDRIVNFGDYNEPCCYTFSDPANGNLPYVLFCV